MENVPFSFPPDLRLRICIPDLEAAMPFFLNTSCHCAFQARPVVQFLRCNHDFASPRAKDLLHFNHGRHVVSDKLWFVVCQFKVDLLVEKFNRISA